jgi:DNA primase
MEEHLEYLLKQVKIEEVIEDYVNFKKKRCKLS